MPDRREQQRQEARELRDGIVVAILMVFTVAGAIAGMAPAIYYMYKWYVFWLPV